MTFGILVRDDRGGLGNLTVEAWSNLKPDLTVVVQSRPCRGEPRPDVFTADWTTTVHVPNPIPDQWWITNAGAVDVWWTAETWYSNIAEQAIRDAGSRSVLYVMPELFRSSNADDLWNPTGYLTQSLPARTQTVEWPTTLPDTWHLRSEIRRVVHVSSGARGDRNGTGEFVEALRLVESDLEVVVHHPDRLPRLPRRWTERVGSGVSVTVQDAYVDDLTGLYRWADLLVMPRHYAGLSLPVLEAAATGCVVLMSDTEPQTGWPVVLCPSVPGDPEFPVGHPTPTVRCVPPVLAAMIDSLAGLDSLSVARLSERSRVWSEGRSWQVLGSVWRDLLCA